MTVNDDRGLAWPTDAELAATREDFARARALIAEAQAAGTPITLRDGTLSTRARITDAHRELRGPLIALLFVESPRVSRYASPRLR